MTKMSRAAYQDLHELRALSEIAEQSAAAPKPISAAPTRAHAPLPHDCAHPTVRL